MLFPSLLSTSIHPSTTDAGVRDTLLGTRRGRGKTVCARGACPTWSCGPSTSPLGVVQGARLDHVATL
jgi:hypothetical protein